MDASTIGDALWLPAGTQSLQDRRQTCVVGSGEQRFQVVISGPDASGSIDAPQRLRHRLLETPSDRHDLSGTAHAGTDAAVQPSELVERPARYLHHDIVEGRLEERASAGNIVPDAGQTVSERDPRRHLRNWVAGGLGGQGGATRQARVDLDHVVVAAGAFEGKLDVARPFDSERTYDPHRSRTQPVILAITEGL